MRAPGAGEDRLCAGPLGDRSPWSAAMTWHRLLDRLFRRPPSRDDSESRRAFVDPLTGLATRHAMTDRLHVARKDGLQGTVVMFDIDLFKHFNDSHGHQLGDVLLGVIASRLRERLPATAALGRHGGDAFIAFLPGMEACEAVRLARKCQDQVREPVALGDGATVIVTLSAGVATFGVQTIDDVLQSCEVALYAAKARGRDRVVLFDDDTRQIVSARRELASTVIELQERNRALREEARTDALTGLRNRLALDEVLEMVVGGTDRRLQTAAVAFIDVDHFGNFNHVHGDASGDEALRSVASVIKACAREADFVFRKGGEEFVVVLPGAEKAAAHAAAERIRTSVEELALPHSGSAIAPVVTVTVGVACGFPGYTIRQLLNAAAEQAMAAKVNNERNRVHAVRLRGVDVPDYDTESGVDAPS
jgi:diguanylate cyclase (GGDEF)-like protein